MTTSIAETDQIPVLEDRINPAEETDMSKDQPDNPDSKSLNPFLPHENLARLAHERAEFQKQFQAFFDSQAAQRPASAVLKDTQDIDRIVHLATQKVLAEYMPQIEQRIRAEVIRQMGQATASSKKD